MNMSTISTALYRPYIGQTSRVGPQMIGNSISIHPDIEPSYINTVTNEILPQRRPIKWDWYSTAPETGIPNENFTKHPEVTEKRNSRKRFLRPIGYFLCCACILAVIAAVVTSAIIIAELPLDKTIILTTSATSATAITTVVTTATGATSISSSTVTISISAAATAATSIPSSTVTTFISSATTVTMISISSTTSIILTPASKVNWLINGDAENGPCESSTGVTHPTGWNYNGTITQMYYNNTNGDIMSNDPGPNNRGSCYFCGQTSVVTSMWQTVNMTSAINPIAIDNHTVWFNLSAWIGGYQNQDDNAQVSLIFIDQANQKVGNNVTLGPVLASDRGSITSLIFRQANGLMPIGARSFIITVIMTRLQGGYNNGDIDNIAVVIYQ